jgi:hypothetical protein
MLFELYARHFLSMLINVQNSRSVSQEPDSSSRFCSMLFRCRTPDIRKEFKLCHLKQEPLKADGDSC